MTDCPLIFDGTRYYESNAFKFEFEIFYNGNIMDKLPTIEVTGYNHNISTSSSYDGAIIGDDTTYSEVFDIVYNSTLYVKLGSKKSFNLSVSNIKDNVKSIDFGDYGGGSDFETKTSQDFGGDTILKLVMKENKYLEKITLSFNNSMKDYDLAITWDSKNQKLSTNGQELVKGADYIQLGGRESNCFEKISIKVSWEDNFWGTAILTFEIKIEFIKNSIKVVSTNSQDLTNEIKTYTQFGTNNTAESKEEFDVAKRTNLNEVLKPYYYSGYTFLGWFKYDEASNKADTSEQVNTSVPVTENFKLVAYYNISATVHQITYYHWSGSVDEGEYVTRDDLKITVNDSTDYFDAINGSTTSGRAKKIISPATESWPVGYYFAGYVVMAEDTDKSTRLTSSAINPNAGRNVKGSLFSCENMVDFDLHIYATYDKYEFKTTAGGCTISFGEVLPDGTVRKFTTGDVNYVKIADLGTYKSSINAGMSREAALEIAGYSECSAGSAENIVAVIFKNPDGSYGYKNGNSYIFAVAKRINEE